MNTVGRAGGDEVDRGLGGLVLVEPVLGDELARGQPASTRRDMSWRAGIEQNARVSSTKPDVREKPAVSVTAARKRRIASGASRNHHGAPDVHRRVEPGQRRELARPDRLVDA